jgi:hypothetical protein
LCQDKCFWLNKKCCEGTCQPKCEEVYSETLCSSENNILCPACVGMLGNCTSIEVRFYTDATIYNCGGGCPGDCDYEYPYPDCYEVYSCSNYIHYTFAECTSYPGEIMDPLPLDCYEQLVGPWSCTRCQQGDYSHTVPVVSKRCK